MDRAENQAEYEYKALHAPNSIRILRIFADPHDAPLRAELDEVHLNQEPSYAALSYVWGNSDPENDLHIGGSLLRIRKNLFQAIRRLRIQGTMCIWIDAVCINQGDNQERASQVMLMRQIYESASLVLVYLGEIDTGCDFQELLGSILYARNLLPTKVAGGATPELIDWNNLGKYGLPDMHDAQWQHLIRLLENPWFSRVWVFQESLVARKCTFIAGDCSFDQQIFFYALHIMDGFQFAHYIDRNTQQKPSPLTTSIRRCMSIFWRQRQDIASLLSREENWVALGNFPVAVPAIQNCTWVRSPLIKLLREDGASGPKASNPRDYVFGMLGISKEAEVPALRPNYDETVEQVFERVAKYMVENGYGSLLLNSAPRAKKLETPSWVPRWGGKDNSTVLPSRDRAMVVSKVFQAAAQTTALFKIHQDQKTLRVRCIIVDTITKLGTSRYTHDSGEVLVELDELVMACLAEIFFTLLGANYSYPNGETMVEVMCRLAVCDRLQTADRKAPREFQTAMETYISFAAGHFQREILQGQSISLADKMYAIRLALVLLDGKTPATDIETLKWASQFRTAAWLQFRRAIRCATQRGYIGQVHRVAKVGDIIAIIQGCEIPYLLRPSNGHQYSLISDCYIHGIMYGEAWDETVVQDIEIV
jgi:hypothetical protein